MYDNFEDFWTNEIEQNVTANRAKKFAQAAWDYQQKKIEKIRTSLSQYVTQSTSDTKNEWSESYE